MTKKGFVFQLLWVGVIFMMLWAGLLFGTDPIILFTIVIVGWAAGLPIIGYAFRKKHTGSVA